MSLNNSSKLKVSGMLAAVIVVVGTIAIISNSTLYDSSGVSADVADLATGDAIIVPLSVHQEVIGDLNSYFELQDDKVAQDKIIQEVVNTLSELVN